MKKAKLAIPCHWNKQVLNKIIKQNSRAKSVEIIEIYGTLARGPIGHGRAPSLVPQVSRVCAINLRKHIKSCGIKFVYLLNAPITFKENKKNRKYLDWIINDLKADALMITSHALMNFVRKKYPFVPIYISTIAGVLNAKQLEKFKDINPVRVTVHHDVNRNFKDLEGILKKAKDLAIDIEVMATESCLRRCPNRKAHYKHLVEGTSDEPFHMTCNRKKLMYPREFLRANIIRPEDMALYEKMGINIFKITGRSKPAHWLPEVTNAYLKRKYTGNLIRLLGIDPSLKAEEWIYLNNKALDGFLKSFPKTGKEKDEKIYCDKWILKLYKKGDFSVNDGTRYEINKKGLLYCRFTGKRATSLIF